MTINKEEFEALNHKTVPFSGGYDVAWLYKDVTYTITKVTYNEVANSLVMTLKWRIDKTEYVAAGIAIQTGVNIVQQLDTKLPSLVAVNKRDRGANVTNIEDMQLYVLEEFDKYFITGE
jgi:hypothetical protein